MPETLEVLIRRRGQTVSEVARRAHVSRSVAYKAVAGERVSTPVARALAKALGLTIEELDRLIERSARARRPRPGVRTRSSAGRPRTRGWLRQTLARLKTVELLPENWDGEGGPRVDESLLAAARTMLRKVAPGVDRDVPPPRVAPISGGAFQLEWQVGNRYLEFEFSDPEKLLFLTDEETPRGDIMTSGECPVEMADKARELLSWLMGRPAA